MVTRRIGARALTIGEAAARLGTTPRMLRYREALGLLPRGRGAQRRYGPRDLAAVAAAIACERRWDVSPAALAFAVRAMSDPVVAADVREVVDLVKAPAEPGLAALGFDQEKAQRLLRLVG